MHGIEMATSWDYQLIVLSVIIAIIGSFVALDFAGRMKSSQGRSRKLWFFGGALLMGLAIWSMHFVGMMALIMPMPMTYDEALMALSIVAAVSGSGIAFAIMNRQSLGRIHMVMGSLAMGLAISTMHYTGMASMQMSATIEYNPFLFTLSVIIAITASAAALWIAFRMRRDNPNVWFWQKLGSAIIMGFAISGMHYTGMLAAHYNHTGVVVSGITAAPMVGNFKLSDLLIAASVLFGATLLLLTSQSVEEKQRALQTLKKTLEREKLAANIVDSIRSETDLVTILKQSVKHLGQFTQADHCAIWPYDPKDQTFKNLYEYPTNDSSLPETNRVSSRIPILSSLNHVETFVFPDILQAPGLTDEDKQLILEKGITSLLQVPILYKDELLGILRIYTVKKRYWENETVSLIQNIAAQLAIALYNTQTFEELKDSEARKTAILDSSLDAVITIDENAAILEWNPRAEEIFGYTASEILGKSLTTAIIPERYREAHQKGMQHYLATGEGPVLGKLLELPTLRKDGTEFPAELWIVPIRAKGQILFTSTLRDITERKRAETEIIQLTQDLERRVEERTHQLEVTNTELKEEIYLRETTEEELSRSEQRFRLLVSSVQDYAIYMLDAEGCIKTWNEGAERIKGYKPNEVMDKHFSMFYPQDAIDKGAPEAELKIAAETGRFEDEGWKIRKDGSRFWASVIITAIRNEQGELIGFSKITRDLTRRKEMEEELLFKTHQLEAVNKELEAFSYSVSHDLRAPLRTVDGFSQAVLEMASAKLNEREKDYLNRVRAGSQQMATLIDDILSLSRLTRGNLNIEEQVDLSAIAQEIADELQRQEPERQVKFDIEQGMIARGDRRLLQAALQNLIGNSWKYTSRHPSAHIEFAKFENGKVVHYIKDDGAGFDMAYSEKLFGAFQRLHGIKEFAGTGVGLATVARIIHRHGGEVWAEGEVEKGATFYFTLETTDLDKEDTDDREQQSYLTR